MQPIIDLLFVKDVQAGQRLDFVALLKFFEADCARHLLTKVFVLVHHLHRQCINVSIPCSFAPLATVCFLMVYQCPQEAQGDWLSAATHRNDDSRPLHGCFELLRSPLMPLSHIARTLRDLATNSTFNARERCANLWEHVTVEASTMAAEAGIALRGRRNFHSKGVRASAALHCNRIGTVLQSQLVACPTTRARGLHLLQW